MNTVYVEEHSRFRDMCTCPQCQIVWMHYERGYPIQYDYALKWAKTRYSTYQCPECGTWSVLLTKRTFRQVLAGTVRQVIAAPEPHRDYGDHEQEEER